MTTILKDVRYVARMLARSPAFSLIAIVTLGLGIGVNSTIFSVVNAYLFRPLPVSRPEELVAIASRDQKIEFPLRVSYPNYRDILDRTDVFTDAIGLADDVINMSVKGQPERIEAALVTGNYFTMLGVGAAIGRAFTAKEDRIPGADQVVVLSDFFWKKKFGADAAVLGTSINLNGKAFTIIGVTPESFPGTDAMIKFDLYVPLGTMSTLFRGREQGLTNRSSTMLKVIARLQPGVTVDKAGAALNVLASQLSTQYPETNKGSGFIVVPETKSRPTIEVAGAFNSISLIFMSLVSMVLLIACINVANLMLARALSRQKELAVRTALGASRGQIIRLFLTEGILVSCAGGVTGLLLAYCAGGLLSGYRLAVGDLSVAFDFSLDNRVLVFTFVAVLAAGILSGLLPAISSARRDLNDVLKESGRGTTEGSTGSRLRNALVIGQVAVSLLLLIAAGLFVRSLQGAEKADVGFRTNNVLLASMDVGLQGYDQPKGEQFYRQLLERVRALPGVRQAALSSNIPFGTSNTADEVTTEDSVSETSRGDRLVLDNFVGTDYFKTMGVSILAGRDFTEQDNKTSPPVAIVSQAMARRFWPGQDPLGKTFKMGRDGTNIQVVGLTRDEKHIFIGEDYRPYMYLPFAQHYHSDMTLELYTGDTPSALAGPVTQTIHEQDGDLPVYGVVAISDHLRNGIAFFFLRAGATFAGIFGLLALVMATVGIYGVISYSVSRRVHEIGIRMALGANRPIVLKLILGGGLKMVGLGVGIGIAIALASTRLISSLLYGVNAIDPLTFAAVAALLLLVSLIASYVPALRATRVDPMIALRHE